MQKSFAPPPPPPKVVVKKEREKTKRNMIASTTPSTSTSTTTATTRCANHGNHQHGAFRRWGRRGTTTATSSSKASTSSSSSSSLSSSSFGRVSVATAMMASKTRMGRRMEKRRVFGRGDARAMPPPSSPSSSEHPAETLLDESRALYERGERMQGYKKLERAMKLDDDASLPVRREIRYQAMCCVAAFGDVEMAKQYLREMELLGLPYDVAINDPSLMRMESSALMRNQLKKYASGSEKSFGTVQREVYERTKKTLPGGPGGDAPIVNKGLMELEIDDNTDASVGGIAKRVGGVVLASIGGFTLLFFAGLKLIQESGY